MLFILEYEQLYKNSLLNWNTSSILLTVFVPRIRIYGPSDFSRRMNGCIVGFPGCGERKRGILAQTEGLAGCPMSLCNRSSCCSLLLTNCNSENSHHVYTNLRIKNFRIKKAQCHPHTMSILNSHKCECWLVSLFVTQCIFFAMSVK